MSENLQFLQNNKISQLLISTYCYTVALLRVLKIKFVQYKKRRQKCHKDTAYASSGVDKKKGSKEHFYTAFLRVIQCDN